MAANGDETAEEESGTVDRGGNESTTRGGDETQQTGSTVTSEYETTRTTAPQSPYSMRDVGFGFGVLVVGILVTFIVPLAVTL